MNQKRQDQRILRCGGHHTQDPKANPSQSFSANVDFSTSSYESNHGTNMNDYLTNTKTSSISYRKSWPGRPFNFAASMNGSQNSQTKMVDLRLPTMTFNVNRLYPFRSNKSSGSMKWFQNIQISYNSKLDNRITSHGQHAVYAADPEQYEEWFFPFHTHFADQY